MAKPLITSLSNPLVKQARALRQRKARLESGLFLVEGIHHVGQAIEAKWDIETVLYAPDLLTSSFARDLLSHLPAEQSAMAPAPHVMAPGRHHAGETNREPQPVSAQVMESLADKENPQGILAIVRQKRTRFSDVQSWKTSVALVSPQDPGNLGTILRTMDAVGAEALFVLDGGVDLYHPSVVRASMGTLFWIPIIQSSFAEFVSWARHTNEIQLIGTSAHADVDFRTLVPQIPWVLVLGNEQKGLSPDQTTACDATVSLPMQGRVSSLNLSVAAGVLLYQYAFERA